MATASSAKWGWSSQRPLLLPLLVQVLIPAIVVRAQTSSVSGFAFFDSNNDGVRDAVFDYGIYDIPVYLFTCANNLVETTKTDTQGYFSFEGLSPGEYSVDARLESWYSFVDASFGSACFALGNGEGYDRSFGLKFNDPTQADTPPPPPRVPPAASFAETMNPTRPPTPPPKSSPDLSFGDSVEDSMGDFIESIQNELPQPTGSPTARPTRSGEQYGPTLSERLVLTIRGIEKLQDSEKWAAATADYANGHFGDNRDPGVFDVSVSVKVTKQESSSEVVNALLNFEAGLSRRGPQGGARRTRGNRGLQVKWVKVTYEQTSTYKTSEPNKYDEVYVATTPFSGRKGSEAYIKALRALSEYYNDITSVGSVRTNPPEDGEVIDAEMFGLDPLPQDTGDSTLWIIVGAVAGGVVIISLVGLLVVRRRRKKLRGNEYGTEVEDGRAESVTHVGEDDTIFNGDPSAQRRDPSQPNIGRSLHSLSSIPDSDAHAQWDSSQQQRRVSSITDRTIYSQSSVVTRMVQVRAPAGRLGIVVEQSPFGGPPRVCEIKNTCPIASNIKLKDKIVAVDGEDVQTMNALAVGKLLARRTCHAERNITILRDTEISHPNNVKAIDVDELVSDPKLLDIGVGAREGKSEVLDVIVPGGKLGLVLKSPEPPAAPGPAFVFNMRKDSPLIDQVKLGDRIISLDGEDVRNQTSMYVSKLLESKISKDSREIRILRDVDDGSGDEESRSGSFILPGDDTMIPTAIVQPNGTTIIEINAPPGALGVVVDTPPDGGSACVVTSIKKDSPIIGQIQLGDKLVAVDGEDVSRLKAVHVSTILATKSGNAVRRITVSREDSNASGCF